MKLRFTRLHLTRYSLGLLVATCLNGCSVIGIDPLENAPPRDPKPVPDNFEKYASVSASQKTSLLNENFDNNARNWPLSNGWTQSTVTISGGMLEMSNGYASSSDQKSIISVPALTGTEDFEIEAAIKVSSNTSIYSYDNSGTLLWGVSSNTASGVAHSVKINDYNGYFSVGYDNGQKEDYKSVYRSEWKGNYNPGGFNIYTVRRVKSNYYYFINGALLFKQPYASLTGTMLGMQATGVYTVVSVDYIRVSRLSLN